jgi:Zn-finger nucleic acid-binding protein
MGPSGILVDLCASCGGAWLDKGEVYYYVRKPKDLQAAFAEAYKAPKKGQRP